MDAMYNYSFTSTISFVNILDNLSLFSEKIQSLNLFLMEITLFLD